MPHILTTCVLFRDQNYKTGLQQVDKRAVVVAQLVEWLLSKPEVRGLNPVIGKNLFIY